MSLSCVPPLHTRPCIHAAQQTLLGAFFFGSMLPGGASVLGPCFWLALTCFWLTLTRVSVPCVSMSGASPRLQIFSPGHQHEEECVTNQPSLARVHSRSQPSVQSAASVFSRLTPGQSESARQHRNYLVLSIAWLAKTTATRFHRNGSLNTTFRLCVPPPPVMVYGGPLTYWAAALNHPVNRRGSAAFLSQIVGLYMWQRFEKVCNR